MDWLLTLLAVFNVTSMYTVFSSRVVPRKDVPWASFATALLATELAWIWLPLQAIIAWLLALGGATDTTLGTLALWLLVASWSGLVWSIWKSTHAKDTVEGALLEGLGFDYRAKIPAERTQKLRREVSFSDWRNPGAKPVPGVEVLRDIPYGPCLLYTSDAADDN